MKTEGLTFIEAVQALKDRKCAGVTRTSFASPWGENHQVLNLGSVLTFQLGCGFDVDDLLATDWQLVNPVIPMEEREVKRWAKLLDGKWCGSTDSQEQAILWRDRIEGIGRCEIVELTGTYRVPVKEKERLKLTQTVTITDSALGGRINGLSRTLVGKTGTLTFEWIED